MPNYYVVFEYTTKAGGYAGIRTIISYKDKAQFGKMNSDPDTNTIVIAKGVTIEEAQNLTSLNPEVCHLTVAVHEMCYAKDGHIDHHLSYYHLQKALFAIKYDRQHRLENGLRPNRSFPFVEIGQENTEKNKLFRFIKDFFISPDGTIGDLNLAELAIIAKILELKVRRLAENTSGGTDGRYRRLSE